MPSSDTRQNISSTSNRRTCFVTIGATASFAGLIRAVLTADFLRSLEKHKYTELIVQFGAGGEKLFADCQNRAREELEAVDSTTINSIKVEGFPVDTQGLDQYMSRAKGAKDAGAVEGCVISHAGTGTILSAMRLAIPVIVVPNEELLDNHQVELAEVLAKQGYVVHGQVNNIPTALDRLQELREGVNKWPPVNSGEHRKSNTIKQVLDEEMGYLD